MFGRWDWTPLAKYDGPTRITFMGRDLADWQEPVRIGLGMSADELELD